MLPSFLYHFSKPLVDTDSKTISFKRAFLGLFCKTEIIISTEETDWSIYRGTKLVINGKLERSNSGINKTVAEVCKQFGIEESPLCYSERFFYRLFGSRIIQFGKYTLYASQQDKWLYSDTTYHLSKLTPLSNYMLLNDVAVALENNMLKRLNDALSATCAQEGILFYDKAWGWRKKYLLLGNMKCYREGASLVMSEIVYYDSNGKFQSTLDFGNAVHFHYQSFSKKADKFVRNYFIEHDSPLGLGGHIMKSSSLWLWPSTWFHRQTILMTEKGVNYSRSAGWGKRKTSFVPYDEFYLVEKKRGLLNLFWGRIALYGSQNVDPTKRFKRKDVNMLYEKIFEVNPELKARIGERFRTFRWIPFTPKESILVSEGNIIYKHSQARHPHLLEGSNLKELKVKRAKGFFGWMFFRHVTASYEINNIRYDEFQKETSKYYNYTAKKFNLDSIFKVLDDACKYNIVVVPHMWFRTAKRLRDALVLAQSSQSTNDFYAGEGDTLPDIESDGDYRNEPSVNFIEMQSALDGVPFKKSTIGTCYVKNKFAVGNESFADNSINMPEDNAGMVAEATAVPDDNGEKVSFINGMKGFITQHKKGLILVVAILALLVILDFTDNHHSDLQETGLEAVLKQDDNASKLNSPNKTVESIYDNLESNAMINSDEKQDVQQLDNQNEVDELDDFDDSVEATLPSFLRFQGSVNGFGKSDLVLYFTNGNNVEGSIIGSNGNQFKQGEIVGTQRQIEAAVWTVEADIIDQEGGSMKLIADFYDSGNYWEITGNIKGNGKEIPVNLRTYDPVAKKK